MTLPFTHDQFLAVFAAYNEAVAPFQLVLLVAGIAAVVLILYPVRRPDRIVGALLAGLWLWMAVQYHWRFFRTINPAATLFAVAFLIEAVLLAEFAVRRQRLGCGRRQRGQGEGVGGRSRS